MNSAASRDPSTVPGAAARTPAGPDAVAPAAARPDTRPDSPAHTQARPTLSPVQRVGLLMAVAAVGAAGVVVARTVAREPGPAFPASPSASRITVDPLPPTAIPLTAFPLTVFPLTEAQLRAALAAPPDLGTLADPARRASCLTGLGRAADLPVLGGRRLEVSGRPAVLLLLPGTTPDQVTAVAVAPSCSAARTGLFTETTLSRR